MSAAMFVFAFPIAAGTMIWWVREMWRRTARLRCLMGLLLRRAYRRSFPAIECHGFESDDESAPGKDA